jgi:hypothetical protein
MDGHRHVDAVSDASLDREIESLLTVEPSPEFLARVRARVAEEPSPGAWRTWMLAVSGAVAVTIAVLVIWPSSDQQPTGEEGRTSTVQQAVETVQHVAPPTSSDAARVRSRSTLRSAPAVAAATDGVKDIDLPDVVIAENEVRTFASLVATIRQRRFDVAVPAAPDIDAPIEIKELPPIEPIEIEPIVKLATLHAEGERP